MVHVALGLVERKVVHHLLHALHAEGEDRKTLGLAAREDAGAVHTGNHADLGPDRAHLVDRAPVETHVLLDHTLADQLLHQRSDRGLDRLLLLWELGLERSDGLLLDDLDPLASIFLDVDRDRFAHRTRGELGHAGIDLIRVVDEQRVVGLGAAEAGLRLAGQPHELSLQVDDLGDVRL